MTPAGRSVLGVLGLWHGLAAVQNILDIQPTGLHQRVSVMMGSKEEIDVLEATHKTAKA